MVKRLKHTNMSKDMLKSLKGFEDVFEDYVKSDEYKEIEKRERETSRAHEQFELQHFLEVENDRLSSLEIFLSKKVPLKLNFAQTDKLIDVQKERKEFLKNKLVNDVVRLDSQLQKNLASLFNAHFSV